MGKIFYFQKCEWKYILFLLFFIFSFLQTAIIRWISMNSKDIAQPFLNTYLFTVSDYLAVIPYIIVFLRSRKLNQTIEIREKYSLPRNKDNKRKKEFFLLTTLVTVFDFASHISSLLFYIVYGRNERSINENYLSSLLIFNTVIIYLLSRLILKTYFYKHHYFSFIINVTDRSGDIEETGIIFSRILNLFEKSNFFKIILFTITNLFYNIFIWSIIDKFSPSHYAVSNTYK